MIAANASTAPRGVRYRHVVFTPPARRRPLHGLAWQSTSMLRGAGGSSFDKPWRSAEAFESPPSPPPPPPPRLSEPMTMEEQTFLQDLFALSGLEMRSYRAETLHRRLPACLRALRATTIRQARHSMEKSPLLMRQSIEAAVIGVSSFFRDADVFEQIGGEVIPSLAGRQGSLRIWSAGCSEGQELYSVAMLLSEAGLLDRAELLGTDCRASAIATARQGCYDQKSLCEISSKRRERFFRPYGLRQQLIPLLLNGPHWRRSDVTSVTEPGPWDLICCRNLTMYFQPTVASAVWHRLEQSLRPGGFLVLGKAERPMGVTHQLIEHSPCIYRKVA